MKQASLVIGIIAILGMLIGFIPCFGWFNWLNLPLAAFGIILGIVAQNRENELYRAQSEFNRGLKPNTNYPLGLILSGVAFVFGLFRLVIGGGII